MKNRKIISMMVTVLVVCAVLMGNTLTALAATSVLTSSNVVTLKTVPNDVGSYHATGMGGLSVGESNGKMFVLKTNTNDEKVSILYYYADVNSTAAPKCIIFKNTILGHANAMAIDQDYLYVTKWCHIDGNDKHKATIVKIARTAINKLSNGAVITYTQPNKSKAAKTYDQNDTINGKFIYTQFKFNYAGTNTVYNRSITAITKYRYSKGDTTTTAKFIVNYSTPKNSRSISYAIATIVYNNADGTVISSTISTAPQDMFYIDLPEPTQATSDEKKTYTYQDIFYKQGYGLCIGVWHCGNYEADKADNKQLDNRHNRNTIYRVNIDGHSTQERAAGYRYTNSDMKNWELDLNGFSSYYKYEIESIAFLPWSDGTFRIIFSANVAGKSDNNSFDVVARIKKTVTAF